VIKIAPWVRAGAIQVERKKSAKIDVRRDSD
jgi:hypothetical protein